MSFIGWIVVFFFVLCFVMVVVYFLVVRAFYWGDKKDAPKKGEKPPS